MVIVIFYEWEIFIKYLKWIYLINYDIYSFLCLFVNNYVFVWIFVIYMCVGYIIVFGNLVSLIIFWEMNSVVRWIYRVNWMIRSVIFLIFLFVSNIFVSSYFDDCLEYFLMLYIYKYFFFELLCNVRNLEDLVYFISDFVVIFYNNSGDKYGWFRNNYGYVYFYYEEFRVYSEDNYFF